MEEKQLILKLQQLKQIKPRESWVVFGKERMFNANQPKSLWYKEIFSLFSNRALQVRLSYAFAVYLFIFAGLIGVNNFLVKESSLANKSTAAIFRPDVSYESIRAKSEGLAQAVKKYELNNIAANEVKLAVKDLADEITKNPSIAKEVAVQLKNSGTLASLDGGIELKEVSGDLYRAIDTQMIDDLENTTLTEGQQAVLEQAKELFNKGEYFGALEKILLINS